MKQKKKIAVFIDYAIRIPSFKNTYNAFKQKLFSDEQHEFSIDEDSGGEDNKHFFWREQLKNEEIERFYLKTVCDKEDTDLKNSTFKEFFYNEEHRRKFLEDYSFGIYNDAEVVSIRDIDLLNIVQQLLFDVVLVDEYETTRKKLNTFYFLSKARILPQQVLFLAPGQKINPENYYGIWNPKENSDQENGKNLGNFENWLKGLEHDWNKENGIE